jgi:hypothetical protein
MPNKNIDMHWTTESFTYLVSNANRVVGEPTANCLIPMGCLLPAQYQYFLCKPLCYNFNSYGNGYRLLSLTCEDIVELSYCTYSTVGDIICHSRGNAASQPNNVSAELNNYFVIRNWNNTIKRWRLLENGSNTTAQSFAGLRRFWSVLLQLTPLTINYKLYGSPIINMHQYDCINYTINGNTFDQVIVLPKINLPNRFYFIDVAGASLDTTNLGIDANVSEYMMLVCHKWLERPNTPIDENVEVLAILSYANATYAFYSNKNSDNAVGVVRADQVRSIRFRLVNHSGSTPAALMDFSAGDVAKYGQTYTVTGPINWHINLRFFPI